MELNSKTKEIVRHMVFDSIIIGAGFAGIGAAIQLKKSGLNNFIVLERKDEIGGTWRDNTYPGCACDIPSHLYSYSFELNPDWSESFSPHDEILAYLKHCVSKYKIDPHISYNSSVAEVRFNASNGTWTITTQDKQTYISRTVISCSGPLNEPAYPAFKNENAFKGERFHSMHWNHNYDLNNKKVAVIGTGASAIQFVPKIAQQVKELIVFQRTAPWIGPKQNQINTEKSKNRFQKIPGYQLLWREIIYWFLELRGLSQYKDNGIRRWRKKEAIEHLNASVKDPDLIKKLTPSYEIGCKRVLISDDYYPTLEKDNVKLTTTAVDSFTPNGIKTKDGEEIEVDAIIYGTGFKTTNFAHIYPIIGLDERNLFNEWNENGAEAFKGINVSGFPNLLFVVGPNTGLGHNSIIHMMESQFSYIVDYIKKLKKTASTSTYFDVKIEQQRTFNEHIHTELKDMIWSTGGCNSYYLKDGKGKNTSIWPGTTMKYRKLTKRASLDDFSLITPP
ncbi:NAD(P)/FAD-dependent oxidoreductase [Flavobacteriaceae bacterium]|nr:NAD(P)/FAD-dependent oxidoreductase [Flavobacteriaceae bacterium]